MPWRFYRYMLFEVLKQFGITAVILVIVIAFGTIIKPLSSDSLLTVWDTVKYLMFAFIPGLQYALPFAGAFAVTICLHRMAQDNEFIAMSVSGQSFVRLLVPMALFGATLTLIVAILVQTFIPTFIGKMAESITNDLPKLLANSIKQHTSFNPKKSDLVIWAEDITFKDENGGESERMQLDGVAVARVSETGRANMYFTAATAVIDVERIDDQTSLFVETTHSTQWSRDEDGESSFRGASGVYLTHAIELPSFAKRSLSSFTSSELIDLQKNPGKYSYVRRAWWNLNKSIARDEFLKSVQNCLQTEGELVCSSMTSYRKFIIKSDELKGTGFVSPIAVTIVDENGDASLLVPKKARLLINNAETGEVQSVTLQLHNVTVDPGEISETHQEEKEIHALQVDSLLLRPVVSKSIQEVLERAATHDSPTISNAVLTLQNNVIALNNHVVGRISQRWAVSLIPFLAVILSCLLAIRYSNLMPLAVYAKVFAPTIIVMLLIFSGGNMIRDNNVFAGFSIMWISISVFLGLIIFHWSKLRVM